MLKRFSILSNTCYNLLKSSFVDCHYEKKEKLKGYEKE